MSKPVYGTRAALLVACIATALAFSWQFAMVHFAYSGNWTSLFYTGEASRVTMPEELAGEHIYDFREWSVMTVRCIT